MQPRVTLVFSAAVLLAATALRAQEQGQNRDASQTLQAARFSYLTSGVVLDSETPKQICLAVSRDGSYRILQVSEAKTVALHGKMPVDQFQQLKNLMGDSDFRRLKGNYSGIIRQSSESFGAEISREDGNQRLQWLNPDGRHPFPDTAAKVIGWLKDFRPSGALPLLHAGFSDVCPFAGFQLVQPTVAANTHP
jgi:hypothetical protein